MLTLVIQAYDGYAQYWPTWYWAWTRYWDFSLPWEIRFCTEELDPPWKDDRIKVFKTGKVPVNEYSIKSIRIAEAVETEHLMYMVDDFWLTDRVNADLFEDLFHTSREQDFNCLKIQCNQPEYHKLEKTDLFCQGRRILKFKPESDWLWNTQAAIWRKDFFLDTVVPHEDPWQMEAHGTLRIREKYPDPGVYMYHWPWYMVPSAVWRGQLSDPGKQMVYTAQNDEITLREYDVLQKSDSVVK